MDKVNVREIALKVLYKINEENAYSNIALDNELKKYRLDNRDVSLVTKIVYGTITYRITIDYIVSQYSKIKLNKLSKWILNILRQGIYQIVWLDKIPKPVIVNESVELAKKYGHKASAGFVNAILKKIDKNELDKYSFKDIVEEISVKTSHEKWYIELLLKEYSEDEVRKICEYNNIEPPMYVRVNTLKVTKEQLKKMLNEDGIEVQDGIVENTLILENIHNVENNKLFIDGYFAVQDNAATLASLVLKPNEGENVLDICGAPGGKTTHLAELMNNKGNIICCDIYENRLKLVDETATRLGIDIIHTQVNDGTKLNKSFINTFDKILVDAPCSGFGVIRRKVDIKYQKEFDDLKEIQDIQYAILVNASKYLKVGGELVYSTCTILKEENENTIEKFLNENTNFELIDISNKLENNCLNEKYIKTLPFVQNLDGFFISKIRRIK